MAYGRTTSADLPANMTLDELARLIGAQARGDGEIEITGVGPLDGARGGEVTYVADAARLDQAKESEAAAMIVPLTCRSARTAPQRIDSIA